MNSKPVSEFDRQLRKLAEADFVADLNLTHVTSHTTMLAILRDGEFRSEKDCPVYSERLIYTFYGRAAYRPPEQGGKKTVHNDIVHAPVCFLLSSGIIGKASRALPFDSGGFPLYGPAMHESWSKEDFEIACSAERIAAVISTFWSDNTHYIRSKPRTPFATKPSNDRLNQYYRLISALLTNTFDSRCSSIELQFPAPLRLDDAVQAIVVPNEAIDDELEEAASLLKADLVPYEYEAPFHPSDFVKPVHFAVRDYYRGLDRL